MSGLRRHFVMGLVLLMCTLTDHCARSAPTSAPAQDVVPGAVDVHREAQQDLRRMVEIVRRVKDSRGHHSAKTEAPATAARDRSTAPEQRDLRYLKTERGSQAVVVYPRDLRKKEQFIRYMTGPLYFSPKCRKNVYRVYHHTRDCTIPAYYKRCARLLTRLAGSPQCTEG